MSKMNIYTVFQDVKNFSLYGTSFSSITKLPRIPEKDFIRTKPDYIRNSHTAE